MHAIRTHTHSNNHKPTWPLHTHACNMHTHTHTHKHSYNHKPTWPTHTNACNTHTRTRTHTQDLSYIVKTAGCLATVARRQITLAQKAQILQYCTTRLLHSFPHAKASVVCSFVSVISIVLGCFLQVIHSIPQAPEKISNHRILNQTEILITSSQKQLKPN